MSTPSNQTATNTTLFITLVSVIGVLLLALVAVIFFLLGQNSNGTAEPSGLDSSSSPTASESPSDLPSDSASPNSSGEAAPPADTSTRFTSFSAPTTVRCDAGDEDNQPPKPPIMVS